MRLVSPTRRAALVAALTLAQANQILTTALAKSREAGYKPMGIAVLDEEVDHGAGVVGELLHLGGDDCETPPGVSGARGLDGDGQRGAAGALRKEADGDARGGAVRAVSDRRRASRRRSSLAPRSSSPFSVR